MIRGIAEVSESTATQTHLEGRRVVFGHVVGRHNRRLAVVLGACDERLMHREMKPEKNKEINISILGQRHEFSRILRIICRVQS
jgi:hypothetical protein